MIIKKSFRGHESRLNSELTICMEKADAAKVALITTVNTSHIIFSNKCIKMLTNTANTVKRSSSMTGIS